MKPKQPDLLPDLFAQLHNHSVFIGAGISEESALRATLPSEIVDQALLEMKKIKEEISETI